MFSINCPLPRWRSRSTFEEWYGIRTTEANQDIDTLLGFGRRPFQPGIAAPLDLCCSQDGGNSLV